MADESDAVLYRSEVGTNRGGNISTTKIVNNKRGNFMPNITLGEAAVGNTRYSCFYVKNNNSVVNEAGEFVFAPYFTGTGANYVEQDDDDSKYDLGNFCISAWFRTSQTATEMCIVSKGGFGDDTAGQNDNYSIRMLSTGFIRAGFETSAGLDQYVDSGSAYNDGQWHFVVVDYDHINVELYIDDMSEPSEIDYSTNPETNSQPLVIGKNPRASDRFWIGDIDEVRVWNKGLGGFDARERLKKYSEAPTTGLVYENLFGAYTFTQDKLSNVVVFINKNTDSDDDEIRIGLGTAGVNAAEQEIALSTDPPVGVTFSLAETYNQGILVGDLYPGDYHAWWMERVVQSNSTELKNTAEIMIAYDPPPGSTGGGSGSGGGTPGGDNTGGTPQPTPTIADYSIAITGDWSESSNAQDTADEINDDDSVMLTISTGDNSYEDDGEKWADITKNLRRNGKKMKMAFGNHDAKEGTPQPKLTNYYLDLMDINSNGKRYYEFAYKNFYFLFIDFYTNWETDSTQYKWIKDKMEKAKGNSAYNWRALVFHEPMYTSPSRYETNTKFARTYHRLMDSNNFDFGFCGHNHNYCRTFPVKYNSGEPDAPETVREDKDPNYNRADIEEGQIFSVVGTAGRSSHRDFDSQANFVAKQLESTYGWLKLTISNNGKTCTGRFYKNNGSQFEKWTVLKN